MAADPKTWDPNQAAIPGLEGFAPEEPEFKVVEVKAHQRKVRIRKKETAEDDQPASPATGGE